MKALTLSTVFPNRAQPVHGLFVFERMRHVAQHAEVRVIAPIAWFRRTRSIRRTDRLSNLPIDHPVFFYIPAVLKVLDGLFLFLSVLPTALRIRRTFDFQLVDAHFAFPEGFAAVLLGKWFRRPVIITLRGSEHEFTGYRFRRMAIQWTLRRATRVIAVSHPLAALARDLGVPPERVEVVENGVDTEIFRPSIRAEARRLLGVDTDTRLLISVGHLVPLKGFDRMIRALAELHRTDPRVKLALVGGTASTSGNYPQELRQLAAQLGVSSHVSFTGALAPEQVRTWLNAADLFVLCSDREGCPNVVWEAMACGLPIASAKVGEVEYMVPPGAGVLFDNPSDVKALRETIGIALNTHWDAAEIRRHAESHTWAHVAERVLQQWRICIRGTEAAIDALATADGGLKPTR